MKWFLLNYRKGILSNILTCLGVNTEKKPTGVQCIDTVYSVINSTTASRSQSVSDWYSHQIPNICNSKVELSL